MNKQMLNLNTLNEEQKKVVTQTDGPILVLAGPGSGKTRALTYKIAYLLLEKNVNVDEILAVTFTNKAAKEIKERVLRLIEESRDESPSTEWGSGNRKTPNWIGTFHSVCVRLLRMEAGNLEVDRNFVIYDTEDSLKLIKEAYTELNYSPKDLNQNAVLSTISKAKSEMVSPKVFAAQSSGNFFFEKVSKIYPLYVKKLQDNNAFDFDDLLAQTVELFKTHPEVLEKYSSMFKYVLIDEYQDTNRVQYTLAKLLSSKHNNITVVGDISQSIYSWRGADYRNMVQFQNDYPSVNVLSLAKNYRSTNKIVQSARNLIENNATHIKIDLYTDNGEGDDIVLYEAENERDEARYIVDTIMLNLDSEADFETMPTTAKKYSNFAVLYRTNAQSRAIEEAFITAGMPYKIVGGVRFYDRREVRDLLAYLRVFANKKDTVSWARCVNTPPRKIGKVALQKIADSHYDLDLIEDLTKIEWKKYIENAQAMSPVELVDAILKDFGYLEYLNDGSEDSLSRIENIKELRTVARQYDSLENFLETIALVESSSKPDLGNEDAVVLMTLHSAKGLEFEHVFLVGLEEGIFPHSRAMADPKELEEERRLCYVGITRAKKYLHMTYTRRRTFFGQTNSTIVSRFIGEIPENYIQFKYA